MSLVVARARGDVYGRARILHANLATLATTARDRLSSSANSTVATGLRGGDQMAGIDSLQVPDATQMEETGTEQAGQGCRDASFGRDAVRARGALGRSRGAELDCDSRPTVYKESQRGAVIQHPSCPPFYSPLSACPAPRLLPSPTASPGLPLPL